jgi:hypothetical protein
MSKNTALNNEGLPTLTTEKAAALLGIPPHRLRSEAKQEKGWCRRGKWLVMQAAEKRNCWYAYKAQMPRH